MPVINVPTKEVPYEEREEPSFSPSVKTPPSLEVIQNRLKSAVPAFNVRDEVRDALDSQGGSIRDATKILTDLLQNSQNDHIRLRAANDVLDLHGARDKQSADMTINIITNDVNIGNLLSARRDDA